MRCEHVPDLDLANLHAVLEGCPVGAAVVAHGRLCFANTVFLERTQLAAGVEGLRIVPDVALSEGEDADPGGRNATLCWDAADGNEGRIRLVARMAGYGGEEACFLWMTGFGDDTVHYAVLHLSDSGHPAPAPCSPPESPGQSADRNIKGMPSSLQEDGARFATSKAQILLAEDNEINQQIAVELLENVGVEAAVASNGQEAVDLFLQQHFDLILMDIQMPVMDGVTATRAIRESGKAGADTIPILAMTAHAMSSDREKSLTAGMNEHLTKPIEPQLLYAALNAWLPGSVRPAATAPDPVIDSRSAATDDQLSPQADSPEKAPEQDILRNLKGLDVQAGLSNVAGNRELYLRLLDRFAKHYSRSGAELRDTVQRMEYDASAHEEALRLAHTAKGVAANLGAHALAAVAGELESAIKKNAARADMLARYESLLCEVLDSLDSLPKQDDVRVGQQSVSAADTQHIAAVLDALPTLMQTDWYGAQCQLLALAPVVEGTVVSAHFREITAALEEFDSEAVAEKSGLLLAAI
ncbi:MAG: response regulator [Deltaproteobacteria bacterium]|jgi:CheY-like chemotaxis protein/HPt (histidine-containing phosphotransfer) domain-containing protein|nr:response regulator [Deltaproteobacteria bacterium]